LDTTYAVGGIRGRGLNFCVTMKRGFLLEINKPIECVLALLDFFPVSLMQPFIKINITCLIRKIVNSLEGIYCGVPCNYFFFSY